MYNNGQFRPNNSYAQRLAMLEQQAAQNGTYQFPYSSPYTQPNANPNLNPYQNPQGQPIQMMGQPQPRAICCFVDSQSDLVTPDLTPNLIYVGISSSNKEIYLRRMTNDGIIETEKYSLASGVQEKNEYQTILDQLSSINQKLSSQQPQQPEVMKEINNEQRNVRPVNEPSSAKQATRSSNNEPF